MVRHDLTIEKTKIPTSDEWVYIVAEQTDERIEVEAFSGEARLDMVFDRL